MSGIEIVGLVLGTLPLLVNSVTQCSAALSTANRILHPRRELKRLHKQITTELQLFRNTTRHLLLKITNDTDASKLLQDPLSDRWKDEEFERKLKDVLADSYPAWHEVMKDVLEAIKDIRTRLDLPEDEGTSKTTEDQLDLLSRLKIGFGRPKLESALERIKSGNVSYMTLTDQAISLHASLARTRSRSQAPNYNRLRVAACAIFTTMNSGIQCLCRSNHVLCLGLKTAIESQSLLSDPIEMVEPDHHLIVLAVKSSGSISDIEYVTDVDISDRNIAGTGSGSSEKKNTLNSGNIAECLAFLTASGKFQVDSPILSSSSTGIKPPSHVVPIHKFFPDTIGQRGKLLGSARRRIALIVASSVLELYATPWLQEDFFRNDFCLLQRHDGSLADTPLLQRHLQPGKSVRKRAHFADPMDLRFICNDWIYKLGIFLIELRLGKTLDQLRLPEDEVSDQALQGYADYRTAMRLVDVITNDVSMRYGDVVRRCIRCEFDQGDYDLGDSRFCRAVFKYVVAPLAEEIKSVDGEGDGDGNDFDTIASCSTMSHGRPMCF